MTTINDLITIAKENDWSVAPCYFAHDVTGYEFSKYSPAGQDFVFCVEASNPGGAESVQVLIGNTLEYINDFDPVEEALKWVGPDGHGANGAPHDLRDIVMDMQDCRTMMQELADAWGRL